MNVLQLTSHYAPNIGGVETHLSDLVASLVEKKYRVTVLTYRPLVTKAKWKIYEKIKNIEIFRLPWIAGHFYTLVSHPALEFCYLVPGLFIAAPFIILFKKINVIHAHGLVAGFAGVFWGKLLKKRIIISLHNVYNFSEKGIYANFVKWMLQRADVILCLSKQSVNEVRSLNIEKKKIRQFIYWIDLDTFKKVPNAKKILGWEKKFVVLFVGRLISEKGIYELLKAAPLINKNVTLVIAGVGPLENEIKIAEAKNKNINFLGKIENDRLPRYYSAADVLIVPSVHEEGFGRVLLESLACGTPVIAANRGAIPEAVDSTVGELFTITPENIAKVVDELYVNPDKLKKMSSVARKFAEKRYSEKNSARITACYEK